MRAMPHHAKLCMALAGVLAVMPALAQQREKVTIAIGTDVLDASQVNNTSLPIYTKCWENEGLDVTLQPTNSTTAMQAVLTGQADMVNMGPAAAIIARTKGAPIKAVYLNMRHNFQFPVVPEASPIKTLADFKGKTIGVVSYGAQMVQIFRGMLSEAGLNPDKDVTFVETGSGAQAVTALTRGRVDIWGTWDSQIATAENMGVKLRRFTSPFAEKLNFGGSYFVRDDMITKRPQVIEKALRCVAKGSLTALTNPQGALKVHWKVFPLTKPSSVDEATAIQQGLHIINTRAEFLKLEPGVKWGEIPISAVANMVAFMKANNVIQTSPKLEDLYTNQFIAAINNFDSAKVVAAAKALPK
jgi:NitT/TauT family transport system substrate-binding protein